MLTELNPSWLCVDDYIGLLNRSFDGRWSRRAFQWYQRREFNGRPTDIAVRAENGRLLAGASYCYRQIIDETRRIIDVCIMGTVTTLPHERGRGHYGALLQTGLSLCRMHSCTALLGFATRDNSSVRGFTRLGAYTIPSYYIVSTGRVHRLLCRRRRPLRVLPPEAAELVTRIRGRPSRTRFHYARPEDWRDQFLRREHPVRALRVTHDSLALVEQVGATDRLQWLSGSETQTIAAVAMLASDSAAAGRRFFMYTMDGVIAASARRLGLAVRAGYLLVLPVDGNRTDLDGIIDGHWEIHSGDRM